MESFSASYGDPRRLEALHRYDILDTAPERDFDDLCRLAAQICQTPIAFVSFVAAERQWFKSEFGLGARQTSLDVSICRYAMLEEDALVVPDTLEDERFRSNPLCTGDPGLRFYAGAIIRTPDGFALGTICVLDRKPREIRPDQLEGLRTLARQVMNMLELRRERSEVQQIASMREDLSARLASKDPLRAILQNCAKALVHYLGAAFARIWTLDEKEGVLVLQASAGLYTHLDGPHGRVKLGEFKIGRIARDRQPHLSNNVPHDPNVSDREWARKEGMVAFAGYPLAVENRVVGVVAMFFRRKLSETLLRDLEPVAYTIAQCIERKRSDEALLRSESTARFLSQVSTDLAELTDYQSTLQKIASASVPAFADWCCVDLADGQGGLQRLAVTHADPAKTHLVKALMERHPPRREEIHGVAAVLRTGEPQMAEEIPDALLVAVARSEQHLGLLRDLGLKSYLSVPLSSRGNMLGVLTFCTAESGRRYTTLDLAVATDLAHRAAVAIENAHLYRDLQDMNRRKDEFLATLAHELRNPLAPLRHGLALLKSDNPETLNETRGVMDRQLQQMVRLVDDLLDVSRITRDRIDLRKEPMPLGRAVRSAIEISRPLIEAAGQALTVNLPSRPIHLLADPTRLAQIFSNLLNNASKYTQAQGRISLSAEHEGTQVRVCVTDTGIGIRPDMLPRVFDLFAQEDRSLERSQGGLGIGLTLVRRLVELHGGSIEARSGGLGQGSEFIVYLPALPEDEKSSVAAVEISGALPSEPAPRRILVVDDNRDSATTLAKLLQRRGHEIAVAFDGEEAVQTAADFRPEIVLLDIGLPKLNGYEAGRRILQQAGSENPILIALTGWGQEEDRNRALEAGFSHHLVKPVDLGVLDVLLTHPARAK
jgi:signal transduction histidine kinase